jgi:hypothetical protein
MGTVEWSGVERNWWDLDGGHPKGMGMGKGLGAWKRPFLLACLLADGKKYKRMSERIF